MAKSSGSTRASKWSLDIYSVGGTRYEYEELVKINSVQADVVKKEKASVAKAMYKSLKDISTTQVIDDGKKIEIRYTSKGCDHFANDAMLTLSGKYFSRNSMIHINEIIEKAEYVPTSHEKTHPRTDGRDLWFTYKDSDGRGVYFKVDWNNKLKIYELYSVTDKINN